MNGNLTLPMIHCLSTSGPNSHGDRIRKAFDEKDHGFFKSQLPRIVRESGAYDVCLERTRARTDRAQELLEGLEGSNAAAIRTVFEGFIEYMYQRLDALQAPAEPTPVPQPVLADEPDVAR